MTDERRDAIESLLGHRFTDPALIERAMRHASVSQTRHTSNERLEFLGDAILGAVACELIYRDYPDLLEGEMTKIKSAVVSRKSCARIAEDMRLERFIEVGKGMRQESALPSSLASAALEAVIAAVYLDAGFDRARAFLEPLLVPLIDEFADSDHQHNFKSVLQQHAQQRFGITPEYRVLDEKGPDHAKAFKIRVLLDGTEHAPSWGQSKKQAEQGAARNALVAMGVLGHAEPLEAGPAGHDAQT